MARRLHMTNLLEPLRQMRGGIGVNQIKRNTGRSKDVLIRLKRLAEGRSWLDPGTELPDAATLDAAWYGTRTQAVHQLDAYRPEIERWLADDVRIRTIYRMLKEKLGDACPAERTVGYYIQTRLPEVPTPVMTREKAFSFADVDFGYFGRVYDERTGTTRRAYLFALRLRYSRRAYRSVVLSQSMEDVSEQFALAFEHLGGVPATINLDNFKAAITRAARYSFVVSHAMYELAKHNGFLVSACLPNTPEHKGGVEKEVDYVRGSFWPMYREAERARGHEIPHLAGMTNALLHWEETIADVRTVSGVGEQPRVLFESEREHLKPLPTTRYEPFTCARVSVRDTYLVHFKSALYSVPYRYIGETVDIMATSKMVRIFHENMMIAMHARAEIKHEIKRLPEHGPASKVAVLGRSQAGALFTAEKIGAETKRLVAELCNDTVVDQSRNMWGILGLAKHFDSTRLERACARAMKYGYRRYDELRDILRNGIDREPIESEVTPRGQRTMEFDTPETAYKNIQQSLEAV